MAEKKIQPFRETAEQKQQLQEVIDRNKEVPGALLPILHEAQEIYGYLPIEVQQRVADGLGISLSEVYGVATFYSRFSLTPKGKHRISVCLGTACYVKGSDKVLAEVEKKLGIKSGECTEDGLFSIDSCRCVGACGLAPVMMVDEDVYGNLTDMKTVDKILDKYINEEGESK